MKDRFKVVYAYVCQVTETLVVKVKLAFLGSRIGRWLNAIRPTWSTPDPVSGLKLIGEGQPRWKEILKKSRPWVVTLIIVKLLLIAAAVWGTKTVVVSILSTVAFLGLLILFEYLFRMVLLFAKMVWSTCELIVVLVSFGKPKEA